MENRTRTIITGATGFLGGHVLRQLDRAADIAVVVRTKSDNPLFNSLKITQIVDTGDTADLVSAFQGFQPDTCIHLAASSIVNPTTEQIVDLIEGNITFGIRVAHAFAQAKGKTLIYTSSFSQHADGQAYKPTVLYAATKEAMADVLRYYALKHFAVIDLQLFDTYGPRDPRKKIWNLLMEAAHTDHPLETTPGEQLLIPIHISDAAGAIVHASIHAADFGDGYHEFRITGPQVIRLRDTVELFEKVNEIKIPIKWGKRPYTGNEMFEPWEYAEVLPNWSPKVSLEDGFAELWQEFLGAKNS